IYLYSLSLHDALPIYEFLKTEPAPASISNYRRHCHAAGNQRAAVAFGDALPNFPGRAGNLGIRQIVGEDGCHSPPAAAGHVEIVINTGVLADAQEGVLLVSERVDAIKVPVIPKCAARTGRACRCPCWRGCRCRCRRVSSCCRRCWHWCRRSLAARSTIHAHGEVGRLALIGGGRKVSAKEVAIEERVHVVATWRAHAVGTAGGRVKRTATEVADRRD